MGLDPRGVADRSGTRRDLGGWEDASAEKEATSFPLLTPGKGDRAGLSAQEGGSEPAVIFGLGGIVVHPLAADLLEANVDPPEQEIGDAVPDAVQLQAG